MFRFFQNRVRDVCFGGYWYFHRVFQLVRDALCKCLIDHTGLSLEGVCLCMLIMPENLLSIRIGGVMCETVAASQRRESGAAPPSMDAYLGLLCPVDEYRMCVCSASCALARAYHQT